MEEEAAVRFAFPRPQEALLGHAPGVDRRTLRRLGAGAIPSEGRVDLHGLRANEARAMLQQRLMQAWERGQRCLLVVHGRGLHSDAEPVLKQTLPRWLVEAPLGPLVLAFAPDAKAGGGATFVLLRRREAT